MSQCPLFIVDAFTSIPFAGNPAAVCLLDEPADPVWMQQVAAEMNLSETAYVVSQPDGFGLRWFTPKAEVDLCGHATLASADVLWQEQRVGRQNEIRFHTNSGSLICSRAGDRIEMDFPRVPIEETRASPQLAAALGADPVFLGRTAFDYVVELPSETAVRDLEPNVRQLATVNTRGIIVTARSDRPEFDFVSRFFAPALGIDEDPVTGSAHCSLGPFWAERLGKSEVAGFQASRRGGVVHVRVGPERVVLGGQVVCIVRGTMSV